MAGHEIANDTGWYFTWTTGNNHRLQTLLWIGGLAAIVTGVILAVMGNSGSSDQVQTSAHLSIPLGIMLATFGVMLLVAFVVTTMNRRGKGRSASIPSKTTEQPAATTARAAAKHSLAKELALLAKLHAESALSTSEFEAAKRRLLEN